MEKALKKWLKQLRLNESTISMILGVLVVLVVGILIYNYFKNVGKGQDLGTTLPAASDQVQLEEQNGQMVPMGLPTTHTVAKGEHLWQIAQKYYGSGYNWVDIAKANKLANPSLLFVGQKLEIPQVAVRGKVNEVKAEVKSAVAQETPVATISDESYTVVKGDTLWSISVRAYQDGYKWTQVAKANSKIVTNPNKIEVGMVLTLPR